MYIRSITTSIKPHYKIVTNWGKKGTVTGTQFIGIENHYYDDVLMKKRYIFAESKNKVYTKIRNLFGNFDRI